MASGGKLSKTARASLGKDKNSIETGKPCPQCTTAMVATRVIKSAGLPGSRHLTRVAPSLAAIVDHGELYSALVEGAAGNRYRVHLLGWSSQPGPYFRANTEVRDNLCLPSDGPPLMVIQNGQWYGARLVGKQAGKFRVHYLGYNEEELVTPNRIKYAFVGKPEEEKRTREK